jgi:hypothetical protein
VRSPSTQKRRYAPPRRRADQRPQKFRIAGDDRGRQPALAHQPRWPIGIGQHRFEHLGALDQSGFERLPLGSGDEQRHVAERPRPLGASRVLIDAIEHPGIVQVAISCRETPRDLASPQRCKRGQKRLPMGAHAALAVHHLVECTGQRPVACQQCRDVIRRGASFALADHAAIRHESGA